MARKRNVEVSSHIRRILDVTDGIGPRQFRGDLRTGNQVFKFAGIFLTKDVLGVDRLLRVSHDTLDVISAGNFLRSNVFSFVTRFLTVFSMVASLNEFEYEEFRAELLHYNRERIAGLAVLGEVVDELIETPHTGLTVPTSMQIAIATEAHHLLAALFRRLAVTADLVSEALPAPYPGLVYRFDYPVFGRDQSLSFQSGWFSVVNDVIVPETGLASSLLSAFEYERRQVAMMRQSLGGFDDRFARAGDHGALLLRSVVDYVERAERFLSFQRFLESSRLVDGVFSLSSGFDVTCLISEYRRDGVSGDLSASGDSESFGDVSRGRKGGVLVSLVDWVPREIDVVVFRRLADRFSSLPVPRSERVSSSGERVFGSDPVWSLKPSCLVPVVGVAAGRQVRCLSRGERRSLFGSRSDGVAADGFELPLGSVIVIPLAGDPYLRGWGSFVSVDRRLYVSGVPVPDFLVSFGGESLLSPLGGSSSLNRCFGVDLGDFVFSGGCSWWNVYGDGVLYDETIFEWEDRRRRAELVMDGLIRSGISIAPQVLRHFIWSLMGSAMPLDLQPFGGLELARSNEIQSVSSVLDFSARPNTERGEWREREAHNRRWLSLLPESLWRSAAVQDWLAGREGDEKAFFLQLSQMMSAASDISSGFAGFLSRVCSSGALESGFAAGVDADWFMAGYRSHLAWMSANVSLVEVTPVGPLRAFGFDPLFCPESLSVPWSGEMPWADCDTGIDFSSMEDQGDGTRVRPAAHMVDSRVEQLVDVSGSAWHLSRQTGAGSV